MNILQSFNGQLSTAYALQPKMRPYYLGTFFVIGSLHVNVGTKLHANVSYLGQVDKLCWWDVGYVIGATIVVIGTSYQAWLVVTTLLLNSSLHLPNISNHFVCWNLVLIMSLILFVSWDRIFNKCTYSSTRASITPLIHSFFIVESTQKCRMP